MHRSILFVGGASAGHLAPLIAVWQELQEMHHDLDALFVCSDRKEDAIFLDAAGLRHTAVPLPRRTLFLPVTLVRGFLIARSIIKKQKPSAVFSKGGAVSVPVCFAAKSLRVPIILHESDAVMGLANRMISAIATKVCRGIDEHKKGELYTGNPVRKEIAEGSREEGLRITGLSGEKPIFLATGGSQGSVALNEAIARNIDALLEFCNVIHLTGKGKETHLKKDGYWSAPFAHSELAHLYACADCALSRGGAGAISELLANSIPMFLTPLRGLAQDHQEKNVRAMEGSGVAIVIEQTELQEKLVHTVNALLSDSKKMAAMKEKMQQFDPIGAARQIAKTVSHSLESTPLSE